MIQPFFSIGVTTYNRPELLRQTLSSILDQTYDNFEVIIGNDYQFEKLSSDLLGVNDARVRFINYPVNLQEAGNMNSLLEAARGRYFTWLADDDCYEPNFLEVSHQLLTDNKFPSGLYTSYRTIWGECMPRTSKLTMGPTCILTGPQILGDYFKGKLKIIPLYGIFDTSLLRKRIGGVERLCSAPIALYSEYLFLVQTSLFERVCLTEVPYVLFRGHAGSIGGTTTDMDIYREAGVELIKRSAKFLNLHRVIKNPSQILYGLSKIHLYQFSYKLRLALLLKNLTFGSLYSTLSDFWSEASRIQSELKSAVGHMGITIGFRIALLRIAYGLAIIRFIVVQRFIKNVI